MSSRLCKIAANRMLTSAADLCVILSFAVSPYVRPFMSCKSAYKSPFSNPHAHFCTFPQLISPSYWTPLASKPLSFDSRFNQGGPDTWCQVQIRNTFIHLRTTLPSPTCEPSPAPGGNVELNRRAVYHASYIRVILGSIACLT